MTNFDAARLEAAIARLHDAPQMAYVVCTGAGAGVTKLLWSVAGCSRTLIGSEFPYHARAFAHLIGRVPDQYSSRDAATALATAGYLKGQRCLVEEGRLATPIIGLGMAAAVATDRSRRGEDKVFLALRTADGLQTVSATFQRGRLTRNDEGEICDLLAINCLLQAAALDQVPFSLAHVTSGQISESATVHPQQMALSFEHADLPMVIDADGNQTDLSAISPETHIIFPGSFNPLHFGHDLIAQAVAALTGKQVIFEIAAANADKPGIDREALATRALQFRGRWPVLLSENLPLFIQKARAYGGYSFIIGLDTATRIFDPKYFGGEAERDAVVAELGGLGARFFVCNRGNDPGALERTVRDPAFGGLFTPVPMLIPVSSSDLRAAAGRKSLDAG